MEHWPHTITIPLDYAFEDKSGRELNFVMFEDCEKPNRGFQVDEIAAFFDDEKVGYIKVDYVSSKKFKEFYPSGLLNHLDQMGGKILFEVGEGWGKPATNLKTASTDVLNRTAERLVSYGYTRNQPDTPLVTYSDFKDWFKREVTPTRSYKNSLMAFNEFKKLIDTPKVAYINTRGNDKNGLFSDNRRLGIGNMLYKVMAKELDKRGMRLLSSISQQPEAKFAWEKLYREGIAHKSRKLPAQQIEGQERTIRYEIDPNSFDLELRTEPSMRI